MLAVPPADDERSSVLNATAPILKTKGRASANEVRLPKFDSAGEGFETIFVMPRYHSKLFAQSLNIEV